MTSFYKNQLKGTYIILEAGFPPSFSTGTSWKRMKDICIYNILHLPVYNVCPCIIHTSIFRLHLGEKKKKQKTEDVVSQN